MRNKLIELLEKAESAVYWDSSDQSFINKIADFLIANGVTFAPDNNVGGEIGLIKRVKYAGDIHTALLKLGWDIGTAAAFLEGIPDAPHIEQPEWIPVSEGKPKLIPCSAGTAYSNAVNALTSGRKVITAIWDGEDFIGDAAFWDAEDEVITHWTPVLLPLPELPKEDA